MMTTQRDVHVGDCLSGTGALCPEAQADGVPCADPGVDCTACERSREHEKAQEIAPSARVARGWVTR
jgi:hypothetical protein